MCRLRIADTRGAGLHEHETFARLVGRCKGRRDRSVWLATASAVGIAGASLTVALPNVGEVGDVRSILRTSIRAGGGRGSRFDGPLASHVCGTFAGAPAGCGRRAVRVERRVALLSTTVTRSAMACGSFGSGHAALTWRTLGSRMTSSVSACVCESQAESFPVNMNTSCLFLLESVGS